MAISALDFTRIYPHPKPVRRSLGDKLQSIAGRSPKELLAIEVIVDLVLRHLDEDDERRQT